MPGWREAQLSGELVKWDVPKVVEGAYRGHEPRDTGYGKNNMHFVDTSEGTVCFFETMQIATGLTQAKIGQLVQVEYTGRKTKTPKGFLKEFIVRLWEDDDDSQVPERIFTGREGGNSR